MQDSVKTALVVGRFGLSSIFETACAGNTFAIVSGNAFKLFSAGSTGIAEKILETTAIDLIICDVMMPEEDGITFCARLRKAGNMTPMLILGAVGDPKVIARGMESGASRRASRRRNPRLLDRAAKRRRPNSSAGSAVKP